VTTATTAANRRAQRHGVDEHSHQRREVRLAATGLLRLAAAVEIAGGQKLDRPIEEIRVAADERSGDFVRGPAGDGAARPSRSVGRARS